MLKLNDEQRQVLLFWVRVVSRVLSGGSLLLSLVVKLSESSPIVLKALPAGELLKSHSSWLVPAFLVAVPVFEAIRRWAERQTIWSLIKPVLEDFRARIFPGNQDPEFFHRLTLFRHTYWVWRWRSVSSPSIGWVKIVERTGHTTQKTWTVFRAPDDPDSAEGVAGTTWASNKMTVLENLDDLAAANWEQAAERYARDTRCPVEEIKRRRPKSRSLCGIPVWVRGRIWGVVVIDSRSAQLPMRLINANNATFAKLIGRLLERVS